MSTLNKTRDTVTVVAACVFSLLTLSLNLFLYVTVVRATISVIAIVLVERREEEGGDRERLDTNEFCSIVH